MFREEDEIIVLGFSRHLHIRSLVLKIKPNLIRKQLLELSNKYYLKYLLLNKGKIIYLSTYIL